MPTRGESTAESLTNLDDALADFVRAFRAPQLAKDVAGALEYSVVDALARLLHIAGDSPSAVRWLVAHHRSDQEEDDGYRAFTEADAAELLGATLSTEEG